MNAQSNVNQSDTIGFTCYDSGSPSKTVMQYLTKIAKKDYKWISNRLHSENNAERFMSVLTLEKLSNLNKDVLSEDQLKIINKIKDSSEFVHVCSGCTYFESLSLSNLFKDKMIDYWNEYLERIINQIKD